MLMTIAYLVFGVIALIATFACSLLSPKASTIRHHMIGLGRLGTFAAISMGIAQVLQTGTKPSWEQVLMATSLASIYTAQIRCEILRQRLRRRGLVQ